VYDLESLETCSMPWNNVTCCLSLKCQNLSYTIWFLHHFNLMLSCKIPTWSLFSVFLWVFILTLFQCIQISIYFVDKMNRNPEKRTNLWFFYHQTWIDVCFNHMLTLNGTQLYFYLSSWCNLYPDLYFLLVILNDTGLWLCHPLVGVFYSAFWGVILKYFVECRLGRV